MNIAISFHQRTEKRLKRSCSLYNWFLVFVNPLLSIGCFWKQFDNVHLQRVDYCSIYLNRKTAIGQRAPSFCVMCCAALGHRRPKSTSTPETAARAGQVILQRLNWILEVDSNCNRSKTSEICSTKDSNEPVILISFRWNNEKVVFISQLLIRMIRIR